MLSGERMKHFTACKAALTWCVTSWILEGGGMWRACNKPTQCISEHGRKQMQSCQAKHTQTPYQLMNKIDRAGRLSTLVSRGPLNVPRHVWNCTEPVCDWPDRLFERKLRPVHNPMCETAHRGDMKGEWAGLYGEQQENVCYITTTIWCLYCLCKLMKRDRSRRTYRTKPWHFSCCFTYLWKSE